MILNGSLDEVVHNKNGEKSVARFYPNEMAKALQKEHVRSTDVGKRTKKKRALARPLDH